MNAVASDPVGVIGAGRLGQAMTRTALRADRSVVIANSRGPPAIPSAPTCSAPTRWRARGRRVIFVSGDDANAKPAVASLFEDAGFAAIDLGNLATGGAMQQVHHPLAGLNLIRL
jgi:predicted dinucleotide-binding enzyme